MSKPSQPYLREYTITRPSITELRLATQIVRKGKNDNGAPCVTVLLSQPNAVAIGLEPDEEGHFRTLS